MKQITQQASHRAPPVDYRKSMNKTQVCKECQELKDEIEKGKRFVIENSKLNRRIRDLEAQNKTLDNKLQKTDIILQRLRQLDPELHETITNEASNIQTMGQLSGAHESKRIAPESFETFFFKLVSGDVSQPIRLDRLKPKLEMDSVCDYNEYFSQFIPYVKEEMREVLNRERELIVHKQKRPFIGILEDLPKLEDINNGNAKKPFISLKFSTSELPKMDHGFYKEAVQMIVKKAYRTEGRGPPQSIKDICFYSIARENIPGDSEGSTDSKTFTVTIPVKDFEDNVDVWTLGKRVSFHWLMGLTPLSRCYEVCVNTPRVVFDKEFILGQLSPWSIEDSPSLPEGEYLNANQKRVVDGLSRVTSGLYLVQGPPGTGKTTTTLRIIEQFAERCSIGDKGRILVCAPSNQGLRVLASQLKEKFPHITMALTGVGKDLDGILKDSYVHSFTQNLYEPLKGFMRDVMNPAAAQCNSTVSMIKEHYVIILTKLNDLLDAPQQLSVIPIILRDVNNVITKIVEDLSNISGSVSEIVAALKSTISILKESTKSVMSFLLQRSQVIFSTLVSSGRKSLRKDINNVEVVVVDEASQASVPEIMIPFQLDPKICVLIGDPMQLPATVISKACQTGGYNASLMSWLMEDCEQPYQMLTEQYRMHPFICRWPSEKYYDGNLVNSVSVCNRPSIFSMHRLHEELNEPALLFDIRGDERPGTQSIYNDNEAKRIADMVHYLMQRGVKPEQVGVITFYSAQVERIKANVNEINLRTNSNASKVMVSTVDAFQGAERDIILISVVRTSPSVGFLTDSRRINVAMTRAKHACWVFGNIDSLAESNCDFPELFRHGSYCKTIPEFKMKRMIDEEL